MARHRKELPQSPSWFPSLEQVPTYMPVQVSPERTEELFEGVIQLWNDPAGRGELKKDFVVLEQFQMRYAEHLASVKWSSYDSHQPLRVEREKATRSRERKSSMTWTIDKPTRTGWCWYRAASDAQPYPVKIFDADLLYVWPLKDRVMMRLSDCSGEFAGSMEPPA